jgi:RNA polymerase sigma-70 factor, ECF subfamily
MHRSNHASYAVTMRDLRHSLLAGPPSGPCPHPVRDQLDKYLLRWFLPPDIFDLPFEEIAAVAGRTPEAAQQLASRARRRVKGAEVPPPDPDLARQRAVVDAFFAAARAGDFDALVAALHPDVPLRADFGPKRRAASTVIRGAAAVAQAARSGASPAARLHPALVNGAAGMVITVRGRP